MYRKTLINLVTILLLFASPFTWAKSQTEWTPSNWSIVVSSCDKYSALWGPFFKSLEHNWPELHSLDIPIYLVANAKQYNSSSVKTINIPNERSWSDNMLIALEKINSKYILLFLDDYWVTKVDHQRLMELMKYLEKEDVAYIGLQEAEGRRYNNKAQQLDHIEGVVSKGKFQSYRASLQLAIWEKKALQQILRSGENIWAFELAASIRSSGYPKPFLTVITKEPITYLNAVYQGHVTPFALEFAQQQGFDFAHTMPVLGKYNWRLTWQRTKHKVSKAAALIKRHTVGGETNSYHYSFED